MVRARRGCSPPPSAPIRRPPRGCRLPRRPRGRGGQPAAGPGGAGARGGWRALLGGPGSPAGAAGPGGGW